MPTKTYNNLPIKKKKKIFDAAFKEFSRVSFNKASISNIIKEADIPRGSFYQYFENKNDLYHYVIESVLGNKKNKLKDLLLKHQDNIFKASEEMFIQDLEIINNEKNHKFFKNLFLNLNFDLTNHISKQKDMHRKSMKSILKLVDQSRIKDEQLTNTIHLIKMISKDLMTMSLARNIPSEEILITYREHMEVIKYGVIKNEYRKE